MCRNKCFVSNRNIPLVCIQAKEHILILGEILAPFKTCNYLGFSITHEWQTLNFQYMLFMYLMLLYVILWYDTFAWRQPWGTVELNCLRNVIVYVCTHYASAVSVLVKSEQDIQYILNEDFSISLWKWASLIGLFHCATAWLLAVMQGNNVTQESKKWTENGKRWCSAALRT